MIAGHWKLNKDGQPVREPDLIKWAGWFEKEAARIVKREHVGSTLVSTVFLGIDHNFSNQGAPILWETMVFDDHLVEIDNYTQRCSGNREQAEAMHQRVLDHVRKQSK